MTEPMKPERLAEIRKDWGAKDAISHVYRAEYIGELLDEVDRLVQEEATMGDDW